MEILGGSPKLDRYLKQMENFVSLNDAREENLRLLRPFVGSMVPRSWAVLLSVRLIYRMLLKGLKIGRNFAQN